MKWMTLIWFVFAGGFAEAQIPAPLQVWRCQADCFGFEGSDGTLLRYWGGVRTNPRHERFDAFMQLKDACGLNALMVVRKLTGTTTQSTVMDVIENESEYRGEGYGIRVIRSSNGSRRYQVTDRQLRGIFDVKEATPENACTPQSIYSQPVWTTPSGDPVHG